jgi:hypothetical protein
VIEAKIKKDVPRDDWIKFELTDEMGKTEVVYMDTVNKVMLTDDVEVSIKINDDGSTTVTRKEGGLTTTITYRISNGVLEVLQNGEFKPLPEADDDSEAVNGTQVRVEKFNHIDLGFGRLYLNRFVFDSFRVYFSDPVRIVSHLYGWGIRAEENSVHVNGLSTLNANGQWQNFNQIKRNSTTRHRMIEEIENQSWRYEYMEDPSYLRGEAPVLDTTLTDRFSTRGAQLVTGSGPPNGAWGDTLSTRDGRILDHSGNVYTQKRACWHPYDASCPLNCAPGDDHVDWCSQQGKYCIEVNGLIVLVTCQLCKGTGQVEASVDDLQNFSEGQAEALLEGANAIERAEIQALTDRLLHYPSLLESLKREPNTSGDLPPLVLREDFFKYGITVGTWIGADRDQERGDLGAGLDRAFEAGEGAFAFASARAGFRDPATGELVFSFPGGALSDASINWIGGEQNLYVADWEAALVPLKTQINPLDLDVKGEDTGLTYLLRRLRTNVWRETFFGEGQNNPIPVGIQHFNDPAWVDLVHH